MDISHRTWAATVRLGVVMSIVATLVAVVSTTIGDVPNVAIVLPVIAVAFVASWVRTGRARRLEPHTAAIAPRTAVPIA
jgi:hypothetical protein